MKRFNYITLCTVVFIALAFAGMNIYLFNFQVFQSGNEYKVDVNRIQQNLESGKEFDLKDYPHISNISALPSNAEDSERKEFFTESEDAYCVRIINGYIYRFDYKTDNRDRSIKVIISLNVCLAVMAALVLVILMYIRFKILKPFNKIQNLPYELSKGNLTVPLKESKSRYFGKFIWGLDLLRENLEEQKKKELELQKEKKTLVLSISHDIKTPLGTIKLYAKALSKNLYNSEEKKIEIAENINSKADQIEGYVCDIINASKDDFLNIQVKSGEFYLERLINEISNYYKEKLLLIKTEFKIMPYSNCLIKGDLDRALESAQNVIENAVKYGDGKRITISFSQEEDCVLVTVTNTGCTLSKNEMPHIFDSFWRGSNSENKKGSGLGLYICKEIMRKMDGDIFAEKSGDEMNVTLVLRQV